MPCRRKDFDFQQNSQMLVVQIARIAILLVMTRYCKSKINKLILQPNLQQLDVCEHLIPLFSQNTVFKTTASGYCPKVHVAAELPAPGFRPFACSASRQ